MKTWDLCGPSATNGVRRNDIDIKMNIRESAESRKKGTLSVKP